MCCSPREVVPQNLPEPVVRVQADVGQGLIETRDRPAIHLLMRPIAAVKPHDVSLIAIGRGVRRWSAEGLCPICGETPGMLRVKAMGESMAHNLIGHHPLVPRISESEETSLSAGRLEHRLHGPAI